MTEITVKVDGMACGMCEAHTNDAVRGAFKIKKVTSSHTKGETVILTEEPIDHEKIREVIEKAGYSAREISEKPYAKKRLFGLKK